MFLAEKSRINLLYLICSKEIINAGRFKKSAGVRHLINWDLSFCFIASFAFVLQRHRAKPIPLVGGALVPPLHKTKSFIAAGASPRPTMYKSAEKTTSLPKFFCCGQSRTPVPTNVVLNFLMRSCATGDFLF